VFIDADKSGYIDYWEASLPLLRSGGVILADNTLWSGRVLEPREPSDHAIVRFNAHVRADSRVEHVLLAVRDGLMMARKK
jgi:caffeoyl-CoA O-methyltransferase